MTKKLSTRGRAPDYLRAAAEQFAFSRPQIAEISKYGAGNINDTFLVSTGSNREKHFILQRINRRVFSRPELIMQNLRAFSEHVSERLRHNPTSGPPMGNAAPPADSMIPRPLDRPWRFLLARDQLHRELGIVRFGHRPRACSRGRVCHRAFPCTL